MLHLPASCRGVLCLMCKRKYLIAGLLGIFTALLFGGTASGTVTGQTYTATVSPKKEDKRTFGGVAFTNVIDTQYQGFNSNPDRLTLAFSKDIRFNLNPVYVPGCALGSGPESLKLLCPHSVIGQGNAQISFEYQPCGPMCVFARARRDHFADLSVTGDAEVTLVNGPSAPSPTIYLHMDFEHGAATFNFAGSLNTEANTLTVPLPSDGFEFTHLDLTINKLKTGKKTYYVSARCKKKHWTNSATSHFPDGSTTTAYSTQRCRRKS